MDNFLSISDFHFYQSLIDGAKTVEHMNPDYIIRAGFGVLGVDGPPASFRDVTHKDGTLRKEGEITVWDTEIEILDDWYDPGENGEQVFLYAQSAGQYVTPIILLSEVPTLGVAESNFISQGYTNGWTNSNAGVPVGINIKQIQRPTLPGPIVRVIN